MNAIANRKTKVRSWYLDMSMIRRYSGSERLYHHTAPINMNYALQISEDRLIGKDASR